MVNTSSATMLSDDLVLRRELALRILLQNLLLIVSLALFAAFAILLLVRPETAWAAAAAQGVAGLGATDIGHRFYYRLGSSLCGQCRVSADQRERIGT